MKIRTGEIDQTALQIAQRRFRADLARQRLIVAPPVHERPAGSAQARGAEATIRLPLSPPVHAPESYRSGGIIPHLIKPGRFLS